MTFLKLSLSFSVAASFQECETCTGNFKEGTLEHGCVYFSLIAHSFGAIVYVINQILLLLKLLGSFPVSFYGSNVKRDRGES